MSRRMGSWKEIMVIGEGTFSAETRRRHFKKWVSKVGDLMLRERYRKATERSVKLARNLWETRAYYF